MLQTVYARDNIVVNTCLLLVPVVFFQESRRSRSSKFCYNWAVWISLQCSFVTVWISLCDSFAFNAWYSSGVAICMVCCLHYNTYGFDQSWFLRCLCSVAALTWCLLPFYVLLRNLLQHHHPVLVSGILCCMCRDELHAAHQFCCFGNAQSATFWLADVYLDLKGRDSQSQFVHKASHQDTFVAVNKWCWSETYLTAMCCMDTQRRSLVRRSCVNQQIFKQAWTLKFSDKISSDFYANRRKKDWMNSILHNHWNSNHFSEQFGLIQREHQKKMCCLSSASSF